MGSSPFWKDADYRVLLQEFSCFFDAAFGGDLAVQSQEGRGPYFEEVPPDYEAWHGMACRDHRP